MNNLLTLNEGTLFFHNHITDIKALNDPYNAFQNWLLGITLPTSAVVSQKRKRDHTTTTINAVVVCSSDTSTEGSITREPASKRSKLEQEAQGQYAGITVTYGGFADDENVERHAALTSTFKGNVSLSSSVVTPLPMKNMDGICRDKYTIEDLPLGAADGNKWQSRFITTYIQFLATSKDAWSVDNQTTVRAMQTIWNHIYGRKIPQIISRSDAIFDIANQRASEWRSGFGSTALAMLQYIFGAIGLSNDNVKYLATNFLEYERFLHKKTTTSWDSETWKMRAIHEGAFRSYFVLYVFASYHTFVQGALMVPDFGNDIGPIAALALSAAAVERGLKLWKDGRISCGIMAETRQTSIDDFNQTNWGQATSNYVRVIFDHHLDSKENFQIIVDEAMALVKTKV